ncbi:MAG: LysE family translocator [Proteobacteria bacterium]|nr:LysE family translocator [Pseudomonadota bacterium]
MTEYAHLWLFFVILLGVVMLPGLDMAYVLGSSLTGGCTQGMIAVAGMVAGGVVHVVVGALGLAALLNYFPGAFNVILLAGALYIAWIGISVLRSRSSFGNRDMAVARSASATFRQAALTNLLNPKAYLFMLAIFPQFLRPEYGVLWIQAIVLGIIIAFTQASVYGSVALVAGGLREWMHANPHFGTWLNRSVGLLLVMAAVVTGIDGWRGL